MVRANFPEFSDGWSLRGWRDEARAASCPLSSLVLSALPTMPGLEWVDGPEASHPLR